jgi:hypothetical protein
MKFVPFEMIEQKALRNKGEIIWNKFMT